MAIWSRALAATLFLVTICTSGPGFALPSYSRQTGDPCTSCHMGSFGPPLTPHGRAFKLGGRSDGHGVVPLSAVALASFTHTAKDRAAQISGNDGRNDNVALQEFAAFLAGRVAPRFGVYASVEYSEIARNTKLDRVDIRYALPMEVGGKDLIWGFDLNNSPGLQDPFNTLPALSMPHKSSELGPRRLDAPILARRLEGQVAGLSTYAWFDDRIYAEIGNYRSLGSDLLDTIGVGDEAGRIDGVAPYVRLAYQKDWGKQVAVLGATYFRTEIHPERTPGPTNKYDDWAIDGMFQYLGNRKNMVSVSLLYLRERQKRDFDIAEGASLRRNHKLDSARASASWYHKNSYGLTGALFRSWGTRDPILYVPREENGSRTGRPDTSGYVLQADWTPFGKEESFGSPYANIRIGLQYTGYFKFNGTDSNYDGFGRDASDNNNLFGFVMVAF